MGSPESIMYGLWTLWAVSWVAASGWAAQTKGRPPVSGEIFYRTLTFLGFGMLFFFQFVRAAGPLRLWRTPVEIGWVCVGLTVLSLAFAWWARLHLGRLWSARVTRKEGHRIVDTGPYALVRHPIYTALLSAALWLGLYKGTVWSVGGFVLLAIGYTMKARIEERYLRSELGAAGYDAYASRTPMIVPFAPV
jgi:protein-S-isoprenylcysteine O-methyltransferase Ste14